MYQHFESHIQHSEILEFAVIQGIFDITAETAQKPIYKRRYCETFLAHVQETDQKVPKLSSAPSDRNNEEDKPIYERLCTSSKILK